MASTADPDLGPPAPPAPRHRRNRFGRSLYLYFLVKQAWPFILLTLGLGLLLNYEFLLLAGRPFIDPVLNNVYDATKRMTSSDSMDLSSMTESSKQALLAKRKKAGLVQQYAEHAPIFSFIQFNSYRTGPKTYAAVGLSGLALHDVKNFGACSWKEKGGGHRPEGKMQAFYPGEHHNMKYEAITIFCTLDESTEHDTGGQLAMKIEGQDVTVYEEKAGAFPIAEPKGPYKYKLTYCSFAIANPIDARRLSEWMEYHVFQGVDYFVFYDGGGMDEEVATMLEPFRKRKLVEVVNARKLGKYDSWAHGSLVVINDCAMRMRYASQWVFFAEQDEYFDSENGETMLSLLNNHSDKPYVSFGSRWWSLEKCLPDTDNNLWAVERMVYHWPHIYCQNKDLFPRWEVCLDYHGYRRYAVDPRKASALQMHRTEVPRTGGEEVDTDVARLNRWPSLVDRHNKACSHILQEGEVIDWWVRDEAVAGVAKVVKEQKLAEETKDTKPAKPPPP